MNAWIGINQHRRLKVVVAFGLLVVLSHLMSLNARAEVTIGDSIYTYIEGRIELNEEPFGVNVEWIRWNSGFRNTDLRLGDRIVAVDGVPYERDQFDVLKSRAIGQHGESQHWEQVGATDGMVVTLTVWREGTTLDVAGQVFAERFYRNADNHRTLDEGGPPSQLPERDENGQRLFDSTWGAWYERITNGQLDTWPYILNGGWERSSFNNRKVLEKHLEDLPRIEYLVTHYPSLFSTTMQEHWQAIRDYLEGEVVEVTDEDLAYRSRAEALQQEVKGYAEAAISAFEAELGDRLVTSTSIRKDDIQEQKALYVGKIVRFQKLTPRRFINSLEESLVIAGSDREGYFFLNLESPTMARVFDALFRFQGLVKPNIAELYTFYIEVLDEPRMYVYNGSAAAGLLGKVTAVIAGQNEVFIDARQGEGKLPFAGEIETKVEPACTLDDASAPEAVIACMVQAIKVGDRDTWQSLFATWRLTPLGPGIPPLYDPDYRYRAAIYERAWLDSRDNISDLVYDARVHRVSRVTQVHTPQGPDDLAPDVKEVTVILDHITLFEGEYRTFVNLNVRRVWRLQSRNNGRWEITDVRHL